MGQELNQLPLSHNYSLNKPLPHSPPKREPHTGAWRHEKMATKPGDIEASKEVSKAAQETKVEDVDDVPDPDEDDLDDLDGM